MKKCNYADEHIIKYVICKMSEEEETKFQYHLIQCNDCRKKVDRYRKLRDEFAKMLKSKKTEKRC